MTTDHGVGSKNKDVAWYFPPITAVSEPVRDLLENYSHYPPDEVIPRVHDIRDQIWEIFPWPCVGTFYFLNLSLCQHDVYPLILDRIKNQGHVFLDVGCCFAQDLRKLVHDGAPPTNLIGLEEQAEFLPLATSFFRDENRLPAGHFIAADFMDRENSRLREFEGKVDIVQLSLILHLWDWDKQIEACKRIIELLRPEKGSMIVGQSVGHLDGVEATGRPGTLVFKHNAKTFLEMWRQIERDTGTKWDVQANLDDGLGAAEQNGRWDGPRAKRLVFTCVRL